MKKIVRYGFIALVAFIFLLGLFYFLFPGSVFKLAIEAQRSAAGLVKKEIRVDDHAIVYLEGGQGETIVLLHGFALNKDCWTAFARYVKAYHLIIPDIPGFGESSQKRTDSYDIESQVKRLDRFMEKLDLDRFHVVGQSMGGAIAAVYSARHPDKVLTLALLDTAGVPAENKSEFARQLEQGKNLLFAANATEYDELLALVFAKPPMIPTPFKKFLVADMIAHNEFDKKIWDDWQPEQYSVAPVLPLIQAPVLVLWGDQDKITDKSGVAFLEKNLKNPTVVILQATGHAPMMERPEESAKAYLSFLTEKK
jgi:abhydrolase domain-containing protein 6